ncbi:MAG: transglycosylase domain-containing protein [Alphaproteobacteria bacterium]
MVRVRRFFRAILAVGAAGLLILAGFILYAAFTLPRAPVASAELPSSVIYATDAGEKFAVRGAYRGAPITADNLPSDLANAVVAIEDRRFYDHYGIDPRGIARAAFANVTGSDTEGGSTITQQLARLRYLPPERTLRRKVQEAMIALWLEARLSKHEILSQYLNAVSFGAGAIGADAAARRYFGKPVGDIDLAQSAMLAALIRTPSAPAASRNLKAAERRARAALRTMLDSGTIDRARFDAARAEPVRLAVAPDPEPGRNYFLDTADAEVKRLVGDPPLDLTVTTTIAPRLQAAAERVVNFWLEREGERRNVSQAALVAMAPDGAILAMIGGRDYLRSRYNRATQAHRQPGSLFNVFLYLTALSNGWRPDSIVVDQPVVTGDRQAAGNGNGDGRSGGEATLRTAFAASLDTASAPLLQAVGAERVIAMAKSLGVQSSLPAKPELALGRADVTLLEMTRAMDAIATDSKSIEPYMVRAINAGSGPLYTRPPTVPDPPDWNRLDMMRLLEAVVTEGTGKAAHLGNRRSAGATGTTDADRDAWFVGFTTDIVVGVWVGNDDNSPMDKITGGDLPAKIWRDFVLEAEKIMTEPPAAPAVGSSGKPPPRAKAMKAAAGR